MAASAARNAQPRRYVENRHIDHIRHAPRSAEAVRPLRIVGLLCQDFSVG